MAIRFSTSGKRGTVAESLVFSGATCGPQAISEYEPGGESWPNVPVNVGRDTRRNTGRFLAELANPLVNQGFRALLRARKLIGELIHESKIILGDEESAGLSIEDNYSEKDGVPARLFAAQTVETRGAGLRRLLLAALDRKGGAKFTFADGARRLCPSAAEPFALTLN